MTKQILYFDMDNTLVDFQSGIDAVRAEGRELDRDSDWDDVEGIFGLMSPMPGAIDSAHSLAELFDVYVLTKSPWANFSAPSDKVSWIKKHFGDQPDSIFYKRVIISGHKHLSRGDFLIDDRCPAVEDAFEGVHIKILSTRFPGWPEVVTALKNHQELGIEIAPCADCQKARL